MAPRIGTIRRQLMLPANDLQLEFLKAGRYGLGDDFGLMLAGLFGFGPNEPRLIQTDDAGKLLLGDPSGTIGAVRIIDGQGATTTVTVGGLGDNIQPNGGLTARAIPYLNNGGAGQDKARAASAINLASQSGLGVALSAPPGMWSVVSNPAAGTQATATKAAGGAGVRHIATGILITFGAIAAPVATALTWALRDGVSGAGTILAQGQVAVPAAVFQGQPVYLTDITIPGTAATAMTLEFSAALANLLEGVTLFGFDAS